MLELRSVSGSYGRIQAVRDVNLSLDSGRCLAVLGRNGAGKSTLLKLVSGIIQSPAGTVWWNGVDVSRLPPEERLRHGIVLVPEGRGIMPGLTVHENVRMGAYLDRPKRHVLDERWDRIVDSLPKLGTLRKQTAGSLSGGEQQMVAVGRALMSQPKLLLLDEPSLGLAPLVVSSLYKVFESLVAQAITVILVEQFTQYALGLADDVVALNKGEVVLTGTAEELRSNTALADMYMAGAQAAQAL
jgi:branched-chain amino acid transport system ATP-binding protein